MTKTSSQTRIPTSYVCFVALARLLAMDCLIGTHRTQAGLVHFLKWDRIYVASVQSVTVQLISVHSVTCFHRFLVEEQNGVTGQCPSGAGQLQECRSKRRSLCCLLIRCILLWRANQSLEGLSALFALIMGERMESAAVISAKSSANCGKWEELWVARYCRYCGATTVGPLGHEAVS